ncbi:hypothetical protein NIES4074_28580 [Cylindrospermum sp. NIES-4074]|nr:hypothetical protein NIES4074_28580 [Cylindrospermum sp. NIES-4074]
MKLSKICLAIGLTSLGFFTNVTAAKALDFNFSFDNVNGPDNGTVTGKIFGLTEGSSSATQVIVESYPNSASFPALPLPINLVFPNSPVLSNSFVVTNGQLTNANFQYQGQNGLLLYLNATNDGRNALFIPANLIQSNQDLSAFNLNGFAGATYEAQGVPWEVPGGATIPTVGGLLALGAMRKVRKIKASPKSVTLS